ncbi:unnamed protein product [Prorocentrum cordatum]|uniref:Uncharacterized protein n=1 Tax=Prorocentrum cordatum TaxID=2364126 RepID=A0ABN9PJX6_9DINO|nr:unnamed protein product [Polarella glacialis]
MRVLARDFPDWGVVYLGGHVSTAVKKAEKQSWKITNRLSTAKKVYQTHAFVVRRSVAPDVLKRLKRGYAADAAYVSWSKQASARCFMFYPQHLMKQPGGPERWKDSDIQEKRQRLKANGGDYAFDPAAQEPTSQRRPRACGHGSGESRRAETGSRPPRKRQRRTPDGRFAAGSESTDTPAERGAAAAGAPPQAAAKGAAAGPAGKQARPPSAFAPGRAADHHRPTTSARPDRRGAGEAPGPGVGAVPGRSRAGGRGSAPLGRGRRPWRRPRACCWPSCGSSRGAAS